MKIIRHHSNGINAFSFLYNQQKQIEGKFHFIKCHVDNKRLICFGEIVNPHSNYKYQFKIIFNIGREPFVQILNEDIKPSREIHMYKDKYLCLAMPNDVNWRSYPSITDYTIPWLVEWTYFHEIYKINGNIWEGKESPDHFTYEQDNERLSTTDFSDEFASVK